MKRKFLKMESTYGEDAVKIVNMTTQEKADFYDDLHNLQWERRRKKIKFEYL